MKAKIKKKSCQDCFAPCCRYISIEVNSPEDATDIDLFKWYILHKNISIQMDPDESWYVIVPTKCEHLNEKYQCGIYETRPKVCEEYTLDECERYGPEEEGVLLFHNAEELETYARKSGYYES